MYNFVNVRIANGSSSSADHVIEAGEKNVEHSKSYRSRSWVECNTTFGIISKKS